MDDDGRWWVITNPTNLYSHYEFPSADYTLSFHIGVVARCRLETAEQQTGKVRLG